MSARTITRITCIRRRLASNPIILLAIAGLLTAPLAAAEEKAEPVIAATAGQEFSISLESNRTTGYGWQLANPLDETVVTSVKNEYREARQTPGATPMVGVGGKEVWTFRAVKAGKTTIEFKYVRPWEKDQPPAQIRSIPVVINAGK